MSCDAKKSKSRKACSELRELLNDAQASFVWGEYARAAIDSKRPDHSIPPVTVFLDRSPSRTEGLLP
jgi:hypothetical protein